MSSILNQINDYKNYKYEKTKTTFAPTNSTYFIEKNQFTNS